MPRAFRTLVPLVVLLTLTSCDDPELTGPVPLLQRVTQAEFAWKDARLTNYRYVGTVQCFCLDDFGSPKLVTVRNGVVTAVADRRNDRAYPVEWRQPVDSLFALIRREAIARPDRLTVTYDAKLGYPRRISYGLQELDGGGVIMLDSLRADP